MAKDLLEKTTEPDLNIKAYLADSYLHPILRSFEEIEEELVEHEKVEVRVDKNQTHHVAGPILSESSSSSSSPPHHIHQHQPSPHEYYYNPHSPHYNYQYQDQP